MWYTPLNTDKFMTPPSKIVALLKAGQVGVIPTDTVYGLVAVADNSLAVAKILALKKRRPDKLGMPVLVASYEQLGNLCEVTVRVKRFLQRVWPGPVTLVLPLNKGIKLAPGVAAQDLTLAVRLPDEPRLKRWLMALDRPLVATSANVSGVMAQESLAEILKQLRDNGQSPDFWVNGDSKNRDLVSTLVKPVGQNLKLIRAGAVDFEALKAIWAKSARV